MRTGQLLSQLGLMQTNLVNSMHYSYQINPIGGLSANKPSFCGSGGNKNVQLGGFSGRETVPMAQQHNNSHTHCKASRHVVGALKHGAVPLAYGLESPFFCLHRETHQHSHEVPQNYCDG
jgi:hypothetical protein